MAHETIIATGQVCYRTKLMNLAAAGAFARCIDANQTRFQSARINHSDRAKSERAYFVTFQPSSQIRLDALHTRQQEARAARAIEQEFLFWADPDTRNLYWCFSVASGETYQVTLGDCSCPDYQYRCRIAGINCKHQIAWSLQRAAGLIPEAPAGSYLPFRGYADTDFDAFAEAIY